MPVSPGGDGDKSTEHAVVGRCDVHVAEPHVGHGDGGDASNASGDGRVHPENILYGGTDVFNSGQEAGRAIGIRVSHKYYV